MQRLDSAPIEAYRQGACSRCHRADRLVDIDVLIDYEGSIALCEGCIGEAALVAGFLVTEDGARRLHEAEESGAAWEERATEAERILSALQLALNRAKAKK